MGPHAWAQLVELVWVQCTLFPAPAWNPMGTPPVTQACDSKQWHHRMEGHIGGRGGTNWESSNDVNTLPCVKQTASRKLLYNTGNSTRCSVTTRTGGMGAAGGRLKWEGKDVCTHIVDSCCCIAETSTTLSRSYTPILTKRNLNSWVTAWSTASQENHPASTGLWRTLEIHFYWIETSKFMLYFDHLIAYVTLTNNTWNREAGVKVIVRSKTRQNKKERENKQ